MNRGATEKRRSFSFADFFRENSILIVFVAIVALFSIVGRNFFSLRNATNILNQNAYLIIATMGASFVMVSGGIDLSLGYQMSIVVVVVSKLILEMGWSMWPAILIGLLIGIVMGVINGLAIVKFKVNSIVGTLASSMVFQGISYILSSGKQMWGFDESFRAISGGEIFNLSYAFWLSIVVVIVITVIYTKTYYGRFVQAMGGNEEAARLSGIKTTALRISTFVIASFFAAVASITLASKVGTVSSATGPGTEFSILTAIMLTGSMGTGRVSIWKFVFGVLILAMLSNGMQLAGWDTQIQYIVRGTLLLASISYQEAQTRYHKTAKLTKKKA